MNKPRFIFSGMVLLLVAGCLLFSPAKSHSVVVTKTARNPLSAYHSPATSPLIYDQFRHAKDKAFNREVLKYLNQMRRDPKGFYHKYLVDYIRQKSSRFTRMYTQSLKKALLQTAALPLFESDAKLEKTAFLQLNYLARFDGRRLSHEQGNIDFAKRMKRAGLHCLAENLYVADNPRPLDVVLDLLIDQHVPSLGHRKNMMNALYAKIGIVSKTLPGGKTLVVMDFGCKN